jgi:putative drug exporter of the RND superfamily
VTIPAWITGRSHPGCTSRLAFLQLFGIGTVLAILIDATLVRGVLVPALMRLAGPLNWWAPAPLRRVHHTLGLSEEPAGTAALQPRCPARSPPSEFRPHPTCSRPRVRLRRDTPQRPVAAPLPAPSAFRPDRGPAYWNRHYVSRADGTPVPRPAQLPGPVAISALG